ncbi:MAG: hypothetical protein HQM08_08120 [Candidatus Riflebacteria bacterium]|nr:hypothetical protein [Candidatus Riflebacteria bacterium]
MIEVLIAISIFAASIGVLVFTFLNAGKETVFTDEHFSAMFITQKVLEDINNRVIDNPYFFEELIQKGDGEEKPIVNGISQYFALIEDTNNDGKLIRGKDLPINSGPLNSQLNNFTVQVSSAFVEDQSTKEPFKNLLNVTVYVRWISRDGNKKEYHVSQLLQGVNQDQFKTPPEIAYSVKRKEEIEEGAKQELSGFLNGGSAQDYLSHNSAVSKEVLMNIGKLMYMIDSLDYNDDKIISTIRNLEQAKILVMENMDLENSLKAIEYQRQIAEQYEKRAMVLCSYLYSFKDMLTPQVIAVFANPLLIGSLLADNINYLNTYLEKISDAALQVPISLAASERSFLSLISPPYHDFIPKRKETVFLRKVIDIEKIGILKISNDSEAQSHLNVLQANIKDFNKRFTGIYPNFTDYLAKEIQVCSDLKLLREKYSGIVEVFRYIERLPTITIAAKSSVPATFKKKKKK